jgi:leucyl aminopeptidase
MNVELKAAGLAAVAQHASDALLVLLADGFKPGKDKLSQCIAGIAKAGDLPSKPGKTLSLYRPQGLAARRVVLAAVGDGSAQHVRSAVAAALGGLKSASPKQLTLAFAQPPSAGALRAALQAVSDATYSYTTTKSKPEPRTVHSACFYAENAEDLRTEFDRARAIVTGVELAKEWANRPANHATPTDLATAAKALAKAPGMRCEVLGPKEVAKLGMGAFMAVAQGSDQPLRFIVLKYTGAPKAQAPVVLVGKGITFDSGGISIKPAPEMDEMKYDMSGAASVLGVFAALAQLQPRLNVVGLIAATENLINGRAVKPGDVVTSMSGQTIEILNTDAEGRLVLCDALTYAERFKPTAVVDIATLTGACVIALGNVRSGLFSGSDALADALHAAGERAQDLCWRMPLDDDYAEGLKTHYADVANVGGRAGGAISAAKFLQRFASKFPWAHLDIAGTAWRGGAAKGATGRPVGLLVEFLLAQTATQSAATVRAAK